MARHPVDQRREVHGLRRAGRRRRSSSPLRDTFNPGARDSTVAPFSVADASTNGWTVGPAAHPAWQFRDMKRICDISSHQPRPAREVGVLAQFLADVLGVSPQSSMAAVKDLTSKAKLCSFQAGEVVCRQGDLGGVYFVILKGAVAVHSFVDDRGANTLGRRVGILQIGGYFGDCALANAPFESTYRCIESTQVLRFDSSMAISSAPHRHLAMAVDLLSGFPVFSTWPRAVLSNVLVSLRLARFSAGQTIMFQGPIRVDEDPCLYFLTEGQAAVLVDPNFDPMGPPVTIQTDPRRLVQLPTALPGSMLGQDALMTDCYSCHVVALTEVRAFWIPKSDMIATFPPSLIQDITTAAQDLIWGMPGKVQQAADAQASSINEEVLVVPDVPAASPLPASREGQDSHRPPLRGAASRRSLTSDQETLRGISGIEDEEDVVVWPRDISPELQRPATPVPVTEPQVTQGNLSATGEPVRGIRFRGRSAPERAAIVPFGTLVGVVEGGEHDRAEPMRAVNRSASSRQAAALAAAT